MASSNPYGTGRFKINVNRVKSKKWKDADKVDYGGGWGDDDDSDDGYDEPAPVSADNPRHPAWNAPSNAYPSDRSVTNPSPSRGGQRPSFDQGDERRHFSSAGNFDSPYPTSQRSPFPEPQHDDPLPAPSYGMQSPLRLNTQGMGATPSDFRPGSRGRQYPPYEDVPMSAPGAFPHQRRSGSSHRPPPGDFYARHESPMRPESRSSISSHRQFPPRKQSLSQQPPTLDFTQDRYSLAPSHASGTATATSANDDRPPPVLIRPSDIYKRMAEEMEKARKSHDSSRSSTALEANRAREDSVGARSTASETKELTGSAQPNAEDSDSTRRLKPTLDPVPERKSEYGFENLLKSTSHDSAQPEEPKIEETPVGVSRHGTDASSVYTDRPDPVSASTLSRNVSMAYDTPARQSSSNNRPSFGLPPIGRISGFGVDIGLSDNTTSNSTPESRQPAGDAPPQVLPGGLEPSESDEPDVKALQHQPTMGYTSVVHQAFDRSQHQEPLTHSSTSSTVDRSNSASTADISPIIGRKPEAAPTNRATRTTHPVISQESSQGETPPTSITTSQPTEVPLAQNDELPVAPVVRPGYRRDVTPPGRDNSPAKKPLEVEPRGLVPPHHGSLVDEQPGSEEHARGRAQSVKDKPLPAEPTLEASTPKAGTPLAIARAESPLKGTVRGLADKLESSSGRSSPSNSSIQVPLPGLSQGRPPPLQARLDSFRPVIPGGWQSYTSSAASGTPGPGTPGQRGMTPPRAPFAQTRAESTESVPTAHAPTGRASHDDSVTQRAFAAAASAGSALAGALAGNRLSERDHSSSAQPSKEESEDEWDQSSSSSDGDADPPASHQLLGEQRTEQRIHHSPVNPPPAGINSSSGTPDQAQSLADSTPLSVATSSEADVPQSTLDYFPAPLRTSRSIDPSSPRPALPDAPIAQETPDKSENERLQQEIVKSLTPKSSSSDIEAPAQDHQPLAHPELSTYRAVTTVGAGPQSTIPAPHSLPSHLIEGPQSTTVPQSDTNSVTEDATTRPPPLRIVPHQPAEAGLSSEGISVTNAYRASDQARPVPAQPRTALHEQPAVFAKPDSVLPGTQQPQPLVEQGLPSSSQPFLQKRFSWETGSSPPGSASTPKATSPPSTGSPDTIRAPFQHAPGSSEVTPPRADFNQPSTRQATSPIQQSVQSIQASTDAPAQQPAKLLQDVQTVQSPQSTNPTQHSGILPTNTNHSQISPTLNEPPTFRTILNLGSPAERIKAFDESRQFYATPNEQLQDWLMSMKTAENADLFATNGRLSLDTADGNASHRPSPRRILTESASARHMQEDGKKLMAAAGRFGGKAGHAAKGLFAKGKEKMRNTSMSEKGILAGRRRSSGPVPDESEEVSYPTGSRDSTYLEGPPQIPLNITPASPLTSPTDWFSNRELMGSQTSGLNSILQQGAVASSPAVANEAEAKPTSEHSGEVPREGVAGPDAVSAVPVPAPSPAISALNSEQEQHDDTGVPSRSISQLTKPTDHSPVESPRRPNVERSLSRGESSAARPPVAATRSNLPSSTLSPPAPHADRHDGSTSDAESSDRSLRVPQTRRRSAVSDVSSASPSPGPDAEGQHLRRSVSLSPADEVHVAVISGPRDENRGHADEAAPSTVSVQGAGQPEAQATDRRTQSPSPIIAPPTATAEPCHARESVLTVEGVEQNPPLGRPAQQHVAAEQQRDPGEHRPFSFAGVEDVGAIHEPQPLPGQDLSRFPSQPMSPVSQGRSSVALSKAMSQVSVEEVQDQANVPDRRQSRSYSRPFGVDPNVRHHPAVRVDESEQALTDRANLYPSESPLPSARRTQEEIDRHLQQTEQRPPTLPPQPQPYEKGYRIPGPYVQEYRSPKQISSPKNGRSQAQVQASGKPLPSTLRSQGYAGQPQPAPRSYTASEQQNAPSYQGHAACSNSPAPYAEYDMKHGEWGNYTQNQPLQQHTQNPPLQQQRQSMGPPAHPVHQQISSQQTSVQAAPLPPSSQQPQAEPKKSTFGKLFGGSSSKGSKLQKQARSEAQVGSQGHVHKEKRNSMLRRNESGSSRQNSKYTSRDRLGQLPPPNVPSQYAQQQSSNVSTEPTPDMGEKLAEGKKKRFSGLGAKLFKSRAATTPTAPSQTSGSENQRTGQRIASPEPYSVQTPSVMSPESLSAQTQHDQYPVGPGSYFSQTQVQPPYQQSAHTTGQFSPQYPAAASPYQQNPRPFEYTHPSQSPPPPGQEASAGRYATGVSMTLGHQSRPSDLRINTSNQDLGHYDVPATAPAQVHPPRASPFASSPYNPNPSSGITTMTGTTLPPPRSAQSSSQNPRDHVVDLHKRSRSPRLGRAASDDLDASQRQQPTSLLGTFSSKNISPVGGIPRPHNDQERPFAITVPGLDDDNNNDARRKHNLRDRIAGGAPRSNTPVSVETGGHGAAPSSHLAVTTSTGGLERNVSVLEGYNNTPDSPRQARRESARDKTTPGFIAELPGSKAEGYESEEEIPMSATAYPGQEWMPVFVGDGRWDD